MGKLWILFIWLSPRFIFLLFQTFPWLLGLEPGFSCRHFLDVCQFLALWGAEVKIAVL